MLFMFFADLLHYLKFLLEKILELNIGSNSDKWITKQIMLSHLASLITYICCKKTMKEQLCYIHDHLHLNNKGDINSMIIKDY